MKLHLGCGEKYLEGFTHVDLLNFDHIDYQNAVDDLSFASDLSVELIYASHVLEHTGRKDFEEVLKEWYRVLKPTGVLRLAVPDFESCVKYYLMSGCIDEILGLLIGGQKDKFDYHKMIFDYKFLSKALIKIGFKSVSHYDWKETSHSNVDDFSQAFLPHMDKKHGMLMSLNIEAIK